MDHVELFGASPNPGADSRNFVLCPGKAYDRSPCGTGTSAKLACLAADGSLAEGEDWIQESVIGSTFTAKFSLARSRPPARLRRTISGRAHVTAESALLLDAAGSILLGNPMNEPLLRTMSGQIVTRIRDKILVRRIFAGFRRCSRIPSPPSSG